jgi:hypothetical protein
VTSLGLPSTQPDITTLERQARAFKRPDLPPSVRATFRAGRHCPSRRCRRPPHGTDLTELQVSGRSSAEREPAESEPCQLGRFGPL